VTLRKRPFSLRLLMLVQLHMQRGLRPDGVVFVTLVYER
jgi:hypothetical protein